MTNPSSKLQRLSRLACLAALASVGALAHAADAGHEEIRFYLPGETGIATRAGAAADGVDVCSDAGNGDVCAYAGLNFASDTAGLLATYSWAETETAPLTYQTLSSPFSGLGVKAADGLPGAAQTIDQGEGLSLLFANPVEVLGFTFFDVNHQVFGPQGGTTIQLIVDEHRYTLNAGDTSLLSSIKGREFSLLGGSTSYYLGAVRIAAAVPEAGTWALMGLGLLGVGMAVRRQRQV